MLDPHGMLAEVHPDLGKVIEATAQSPVEFQVTYGLRSLAAEEEAVATGHSQTLHSRHLAQPQYGGKCCAVDLTPIVNGELTFTPPGGVDRTYGQLAAQVAAAAASAGVPIRWGGSWGPPATDAAINAHSGDQSRFPDWGHFELPTSVYP
jgi:peptidoglycan L-alanyl-D-glutamate endopeptidase CwlK